jgi:hypothetical protein
MCDVSRWHMFINLSNLWMLTSNELELEPMNFRSVLSPLCFLKRSVPSVSVLRRYTCTCRVVVWFESCDSTLIVLVSVPPWWGHGRVCFKTLLSHMWQLLLLVSLQVLLVKPSWCISCEHVKLPAASTVGKRKTAHSEKKETIKPNANFGKRGFIAYHSVMIKYDSDWDIPFKEIVFAPLGWQIGVCLL